MNSYMEQKRNDEMLVRTAYVAAVLMFVAVMAHLALSWAEPPQRTVQFRVPVAAPVDPAQAEARRIIANLETIARAQRVGEAAR